MNAPLSSLSLHTTTLALHRQREALNQLRQARDVPPHLFALVDQLDASSRAIEATLSSGVGELAEIGEGMSMALRLLSEAGETPLPGLGLLCLLKPLNQQFQTALHRVTALL